MKYQFNIGDKVIINELANLSLPYDHIGEIGFVTDRHPYPKGCEPPYDVDFGNREIQSYYDFELDRISP